MACIMDEEGIRRALTRMSHQLLERNHGAENLYLVGIRRRGVPLSRRMAEVIAAAEGCAPPTGELDISFYRDDLSRVQEAPRLHPLGLLPVEGKDVVLVDDVLYTGRTARAAMEAIIDMGRPRTIQLAVLVDRGHRELPIRADIVGKNIPTSRQEMIRVCVREFDGEEAVYLEPLQMGNPAQADHYTEEA